MPVYSPIRMSTALLVTGFGPFPGAPFNPTGPLALALARRRRPAFAEVRRVAHVFPTSYAAVERELPELIAQHRPDGILMFGLATRTKHLRVEMQACNAITSVFADVDGFKPAARTLSRSGPAFLRVPAPNAHLLQAARATGVPVELSHNAGRYLCNALYWRALEAGARRDGPRVISFVHVPRLRPDLNLSDLVRAGEAIMLAVLTAVRRQG